MKTQAQLSNRHRSHLLNCLIFLFSFVLSAQSVYFTAADSYVELPLFRNEKSFEMSMEINPVEKHALLLYGESKRHRDFVSIALNDGFVEVR